MSGFTFSQPSSPTTGLQNYSLDRGVKNLAPDTALLSMLRRRAAVRRSNKALRGSQQRKGKHPMTDTIKSMVNTLSKSVANIIEAGGDNRENLLQKSFSEFGDILAKEVSGQIAAEAGALVKLAPPDLLYKGMGQVGRIANLVSHISDRVKCIKDGKDYSGQTFDKGETPDVPSDATVAFLEHVVAAAELALRQAVNEHVEVADDDDVPGDGETMAVLKMADGAEVMVRGRLPEELMKLACDPQHIAEAMIDEASGVLLGYGVSEAALTKLFSGGDLAKAAQVDPANSAGGGDGGSAGADAGASDTTGADNSGDGDDGSADTGVDDPIQALNVCGRLAAALMIQIDGVMRMFEGDGGDAGSGDSNDNASQGDQATQVQTAGGGTEQPKGISPGSGGMAKVATLDPEVDRLQKQVDGLTAGLGETTELLKRVLKLPQAPKGVLAEYSDSLAKSADSVNADRPIQDKVIEDALAKLSPEQQMQVRYQMTRGRDPRTIELLKLA